MLCYLSVEHWGEKKWGRGGDGGEKQIKYNTENIVSYQLDMLYTASIRKDWHLHTLQDTFDW